MRLHRTGHDRPYPLLALMDESPPPHLPSSCTRFLPKTSSPIVAAAVFDNPASQYTRGRTRIPEIVVLPQYTARSRDPLFRRHGKNTKRNTNTHTHTQACSSPVRISSLHFHLNLTYPSRHFSLLYLNNFQFIIIIATETVTLHIVQLCFFHFHNLSIQEYHSKHENGISSLLCHYGCFFVVP